MTAHARAPRRVPDDDGDEGAPDAVALRAYVDSMMPLVRYAALIGAALLLTQVVGPQRADDALSNAMFDAQPSSRTSHAGASASSAPQRESPDGVRRRGANASVTALLPDENASATVARVVNRSQGRCPGLAAAFGARGAPRHIAAAPMSAHAEPAGADDGSWSTACGLRLVRGGRPLVYVYPELDADHRALLSARGSETFLDIWHPNNQYLSDFAFHRSLLASDLVTTDPSAAAFYFVPFYSRVSLHNHTRHAALTRRLRAMLLASPHWKRSRGRDHVLVVSSTKPMESLFREALPLIRRALLLKVELGDTRRHSARRQHSHVAVPYYVPWLAKDDAVTVSTKKYSVCLEATVSTELRRSLFNVFEGVPHAVLRQRSKAEAERIARLGPAARRARTVVCGTRRRMRECRFCVVPAGLTPSSRRFYEALAAKCVPVVVGDGFVVPHLGEIGKLGAGELAAPVAAGAAATKVLPAAAAASFMLRLPQRERRATPGLVANATRRFAAMFRSLEEHRHLFLYELPLAGERAAAGAVCAIMAELADRYLPHIRSWRGE